MEFIALFFLELFVLFLLSRTLQKKLSLFFYTLTKSKKWTIHLLALIFLPGTILHEFAHLIMAHLLFVPVGKMELLPQLEGNSVKLGSVAIGKTDPFRRLLIGIAPFLVGTIVIVATLYLVNAQQSWNNLWITGGVLVLLFEIGNSMFSSRKDLEGAIFVLLLLTVISIVLYFIGVRLSLQDLSQLLTADQIKLFSQGAIYLLVPLGIDVVLIILLSLSLRILHRT